MPDTVFLDALQKITAGPFLLRDLIEAANALNASGQSQLSRQLYKVWIRINSTDPHLYIAEFNCAVLDSDAGDVASAAELLKASIGRKPDFLQAYINLGGVLERAGAPVKGIETWKAMLARVEPVTSTALEMKLTALKQMGRVFSDHHQPPLAESALQEALELVPAQRDVIEQYVALRMGQCEWPVMATTERVDRKTLMMGISPLSATAYADDPILHLGTAVRFVEQAVPDVLVNPYDRRNAEIDLTDRRLRVGYVSSDLRDHAIGYLMAELFELHDRSQVEVFAYYCGKKDEGALNARIKAAVEHWIDIRDMSDDAAAERIGADGIDILVDVNGHTRDGRSNLFARRPAPILVNWLGYPGTIGTPYHHYVIADEWIIPPGSEHYYTEKVLRLPCYQPNDRKRGVAPNRPSRSEFGLPDDAFVFCSFNGVQKLTRFTYDRWLEILRATPNSVLWLLDPGAETVQRLGDYAEQRGIDRARLIIAPKLANPFHLARYPLADLFLDSFPYGAHTTASDALWMGVPLLTISGRSFASRVCGSLVRAAGLPELVCDNPQAFVQRAIELAGEPATVAALKAKLELNRATCDLFNMDKLVRSLEGLYAGMCADYLQGELPIPDLANLDVYLKAAIEFDHDSQEMLGAAPDFDEVYRAKLAVRNLARPLRPDHRLWRPAEAAGEAELVEVEPRARQRRAGGR
ncbi:N-acetylglucosamine transferase [Phenylobacterium sp. LjRoot225]|uniref:O-linked N-acetylglucosamine transferase, SPINDLY family protein n=1 Tax=Phenylobacterium sp. LjRoot225 TaxID=3342285 RepID=UPI003ECC9D84